MDFSQIIDGFDVNQIVKDNTLEFLNKISRYYGGLLSVDDIGVTAHHSINLEYYTKDRTEMASINIYAEKIDWVLVTIPIYGIEDLNIESSPFDGGIIPSGLLNCLNCICTLNRIFEDD